MDFECKGKNISLTNKVLSKLDLFVIDFINILSKYSDYVVLIKKIDMGELYSMLQDGLAVRIAVKETVIPNIELKFVKSDLDGISLREHMVVITGKDCINISPLELQIPFKLYLGSDKDV